MNYFARVKEKAYYCSFLLAQPSQMIKSMFIVLLCEILLKKR